MCLSECLQLLRSATPSMALAELAQPGSVFSTRTPADPMFRSCLEWLAYQSYEFGKLLRLARIDDASRFVLASEKNRTRDVARTPRFRKDGRAVAWGAQRHITRYLLEVGRPVTADEIAHALSIHRASVNTYLSRLRLGNADCIVERAYVDGRPGWTARLKTMQETVSKLEQTA